MAQELQDPLREAEALRNLGIAYISLDRFDEALELQEQRLSIVRELGYRRGEGSALGTMGTALAALGDADSAIRCHEEQLAICGELGDRRGEGRARMHLGKAHLAHGDASLALNLLESSVETAHELGDLRAEAEALTESGNALAALGRVDDAIRSHEHAMKISRKLGDPRGLGIAGHNLARALSLRVKMPEAMGVLMEVVHVTSSMGVLYADEPKTWMVTPFIELFCSVAKSLGYKEEMESLACLLEGLGKRQAAGPMLDVRGRMILVAVALGATRREGTLCWAQALDYEAAGDRGLSLAFLHQAVTALGDADIPELAPSGHDNAARQDHIRRTRGRLMDL